ncbi:hypothetical protein BKH46_06700 [Helicobacter sp. 12S02634-8]|uniref:hypothetical protein n=1 Tax=Helicobacter sp. 12S02634-8 TaxID=1476199 RepID=UPI000BA78CC2|nr:hypothetical protein [Helicobacter sp. 12S02634-8]PAF46652.1 hypothetical protein BKH46_06700 [Helicobacter sp. 12S02634-8]
MVFAFLFSSTKTKAQIRHFIEFLEHHAQDRALRFGHQFKREEHYNTYTFLLEATPQEALEFAQTIGERLPMSVYFNFIEFKPYEDTPLRPILAAPKEPSFPDALRIKQILDKNSGEFCQIFDWVFEFSSPYLDTPSDSTQKHWNPSPQALKKAFQKMASDLKEGKSLLIQTSRGGKELSFVHKSQKIMFWDLSNVLTYMRLQTAQSHLLASYEKPITSLCPKEVFASLLLENPNNFELDVCLPYDLVLGLLGLFALELDMGYVYIKDSKGKAWDLSYKSPYVPKERHIIVSHDGLLIDKGIAKSTQSIQTLLSHYNTHQPQPSSTSQISPKSGSKTSSKNISEGKRSTPPPNHQKFILFLSKTNPTRFWVQDGESYKTALPISFEANPRCIIEDLQNNYLDGDKLVKNFSEHQSEIFARIMALSPAPIQSNNLIDIFASASFVLGYQERFELGRESILNNAKKFVRDKGPRIDFKLIRDDEVLRLDYPRIIRSAMSFQIAGLDEATLSYGFIDSLSEFLGNFARDMVMNFSIKNILLLGDMLGEKVFLDKILHYFPKNIDLTLPKEGYIDYR